MKLLFTLSLSAIVLLSSCKKDEPDPASCALCTANIVGRSKVTSMMYKQDASSPEFEYCSFLEDCEKDDIYCFDANDVFIKSEGLSACSPANEDNGNWSFDGSSLNLKGKPGAITDFSCAEFKVKFDLNTTAGESLKYTFTRQ